MRIVERKVQEIGKSLLVSLPKGWTRSLGVEKGSRIKMMVSDQGNLSIAPEFTLKKEKKEAVIKFDENFNRRFFREYFEGDERIVIKGISGKERKKLYSFLNRFMNVQIIEESGSKIVVKCFKIEELSMDECLQRMFFLSLGMLDELSTKNDKFKIGEMRNTMTRFYYMLVMQVRRFLSEGRFTENSRVSLIRAMDIRMVAERLQRIGEVVRATEVQDVDSVGPVRDYYSRSFNSFMAEDFEKASPLWHEGRSLQKKYDGSLTQIVRYSKEISMLVR